MNKINRWLLPEGIEEILPPRASQLEGLCRDIVDLLASWGYEFVIPPMLEYLESLLTGTGEDLDLKTFKLTDQLSGRLMGLRADMTPQVARIDAHLLKRSTPTRLCYLGSVLHTRPAHSGETRAPLQVGAELYGHAGIASDIEIVKLMLATLELAGIDKACIDLGHIGIFRALSSESSLEPAQRDQVFEILQRKARDELQEKFNDWNITDAASLAMLDLIEMNGTIDILVDAEQRFASISDTVKQDLQELSTLANAIQDYNDITIHIDLAELRGYHYHTGMLYTAYVEGQGDGIAFGGRYDDIGKAFGRSRAATGFSTDVKSLMKYRDADANLAERIFAPAIDDSNLDALITTLRSEGKIVIRELQGQQASAADMSCTHVLAESNGKWEITKI